MYSEWDGLSGWAGFRKVCPRIGAQSGPHFPVESLSGKCDPEFTLEVGCAFPTGPQAETASHSEGRFRDTLSEYKEGHLMWPSTYICSADTPMTSRAPTTRRLSGRRHIRFIASSARKGGHLMWPPSCAGLFEQQTFPAPPPAADSGPRLRYLILVVPGARLGSVSLASVWKCSA